MSIIIKNLYKSFGEKKAITDFSHVFEEGSVTSVMGSSGSGKTTLLRLVAGLETPSSGTISGVPDKKAYMFQDERLFDDFSVYANIRSVCGKSEEKIMQALSDVGLYDCALKKVSELSGGMKRRVSLVRAMLFDSELILLDEPFTGLDEASKENAMRFVMDHAKGKTLIFVTHSEKEAEYLGGEKIIL